MGGGVRNLQLGYFWKKFIWHSEFKYAFLEKLMDMLHFEKIEIKKIIDKLIFGEKNIEK